MSSEKRIITTYDGSLAFKSDCKYIKGAFYKKNVQCFFIKDRWYRIDSGYIVFDHELKEYTLRGSSLLTGIVGIDANGDAVIGSFSENPSKNVHIRNGGETISSMSDEYLDRLGYAEVVTSRTEVFLRKESIPLLSDKDRRIIPYKSFERLNYSCRNLIKDASESYEKYYLPKNTIYPLDLREDKEGPLGTFGIEFETETGRLPKRFLYKHGLMPLRDGSINGDEYVTIPLRFIERDLKNLFDICELLNKYNTFSKDNSLHVHQRVENFSKEYLIAAFVIHKALEKEIYSIFPDYYSKTSAFKSSGKNYNNPLPSEFLISEINDIETIFDHLYKCYSGGPSFKSLGSTTAAGHPNDGTGEHKWNVGTRYLWVNFIPFLFNGSGTIEYRIHPPSFKPYKILGWIFITNAILQYCTLGAKALIGSAGKFSDFVSSMTPLNLKYVIETIYWPGTLPRMLAEQYLDYRVTLSKHLKSIRDKAGIYELENDGEFVPKSLLLE